MNPEEKRLLHIIQALEFVAIDLTLYLDTHPGDRRALAEYNDVSKRLHEAKMDYQRRFGPLTSSGGYHGLTSWSWIDDPWPWEISD